MSDALTQSEVVTFFMCPEHPVSGKREHSHSSTYSMECDLPCSPSPGQAPFPPWALRLSYVTVSMTPEQAAGTDIWHLHHGTHHASKSPPDPYEGCLGNSMRDGPSAHDKACKFSPCVSSPCAQLMSCWVLPGAGMGNPDS